MADITKITRAEDLKGLGGQWHETTAQMLEAVSPNNEPILVPPVAAVKHEGAPTCVVCVREVNLAPEDFGVIAAHPDIKLICEPCFFALQKESQHG